MVAELGGPADLRRRPVAPPAGARRSCGRSSRTRPGVVSAIDVRAVGIAIVNLGGGRAREDDIVDHSVGLTEVAALGERVEPGGRPLALVHARDDESARARAPTRSARRTCSAIRPPRSPARWSRFSGRCRRRSRRRGSPSRRRCRASALRGSSPSARRSSACRKSYRGAQPSSRRARSLTYTRSIDGNIRQPRAAYTSS